LWLRHYGSQCVIKLCQAAVTKIQVPMIHSGFSCFSFWPTSL
jgi:hypothetical protein